MTQLPDPKSRRLPHSLAIHSTHITMCGNCVLVPISQCASFSPRSQLPPVADKPPTQFPPLPACLHERRSSPPAAGRHLHLQRSPFLVLRCATPASQPTPGRSQAHP